MLVKIKKFPKDSKWKPKLIIIEKVSRKSETYSDPDETFKIEPFAKIVDCIQTLTIFAKHSVIGVSQGYEYFSDKTKQNLGMLSFTSQKMEQQSLQISSTFKFNFIFILIPCEETLLITCL